MLDMKGGVAPLWLQTVLLGVLEAETLRVASLSAGRISLSFLGSVYSFYELVAPWHSSLIATNALMTLTRTFMNHEKG
jgi:hypothetical protein